ncbi:hypothetical protein AAP_00177 [Ascosphaera apis ARSEF 7405]|uniref:Cryptic loci regulator 2 N-terminal domain-containing protein n=1 Tax=Ascosphaera apis ARSEF 7405 TaxID=392613 RepID=A0A168DMQ5_9EURO|nr:hypothetical protein AAP_00177 [Ascosphaera apis ARSEF 7405]
MAMTSTRRGGKPQIVHIKQTFSDGRYKFSAPTARESPYHLEACQQLARLWMNTRGCCISEEDLRWRLDCLPKGYVVLASMFKGRHAWNIAGHPSGRVFSSSDAFFPHFLWLMNEARGKCLCDLCNWKARAKLRRKARRERDQRWIQSPAASQNHDDDSIARLTRRAIE